MSSLPASTLDQHIRTFNQLISVKDKSADFYAFLYSLPLDDLVELLGKMDFNVGSTIMLKQIIIWSVGEELAERKLQAKVVEPKTIPAQVFNEYAKKINQTFVAAMSLKDAQRKIDVCKRQLSNLEKLRAFKKIPGQSYVHENFLTAIEVRISRFLLGHMFKQSNAVNGPQDVPMLHEVIVKAENKLSR